MGCGASEPQHQTTTYYLKPKKTQQDGYSGHTSHGVGLAQYLGYPPPHPPVTRKQDIFRLQDSKELDKRSTQVPVDILYSTYQQLAQYLTHGLQNDLQRVRAIFRWVTLLDISTLEQTLPRLPEYGTPCDYALKIQWRLGNHAHFFAQIARAANLPCVVVTGINKSAAYQLGQPVNRDTMTAQWNAVYVDGHWRLLDVFWASTVLVGKKSREWALIDNDGQEAEDDEEDGEGETMRTVNEFFFLTDPDQLICTHMPDDPQWQLLSWPITMDDFQNNVYIRERFFHLNLQLLPDSHRRCFLKTKQGKAVIKLGLDPTKALHSQFRYLLFKHRQPGEKPSTLAFERFVFYQKSEHELTYTATFPVSGLFKMDIFGQYPNEHESLDLICSYLIECKDPQNVEPLPVCPDIGWGPGLEAKDKGLQPLTHDDGVIETQDGNVEVKFQMENPLNVLQNLKHNQLDEWLLNRFAVVRTEGKDLIISIRLPSGGDFALEMFGDKEGITGDLPNICNYLIQCPNPNINPTPFPKLHEGVLGKSSLSEHLKIKAVNYPGDQIETDTEQFNVEFESSDQDMDILCELHHNNIDKEMLAEAVVKTESQGITNFTIGLPEPGEYAMNVYARRKGEGNRMYHIHTYLVQSKQEKVFQTTKPKDSLQVLPIITSKTELEIRVPLGTGELVGEFRKKNAQEEPKADKVKAVLVDNDGVFTLKLPEDGEYKLDVYDNNGTKGLQHLSSYLICRDSNYREQLKPVVEENLSPEEIATRKEQKSRDAKHKAQRDQLKAAIASQDQQLLAQSIQQFEASGTPETKGELTKAKDLLQYLKLSEELTAAMGSRNLDRLQKAVDAIDTEAMRVKLNMQIEMAKRIIDQLKRIEKLRHAIMKLDQRTIAEIKSYSTPPEAVNKVMTVTLLLLGEHERYLREWKAVVVLIGKTGKESLKRRVSEFNVDSLEIQVATRAKEILGKLELNEVRAVSSGAATFFVWNMGMIEECESRFMQNGGDLSTVQTKGNKT